MGKRANPTVIGAFIVGAVALIVIGLLVFGRGHFSDFSVVLLRSDFVLFSEKNHMKVLQNQWVWTMPCPSERLARAIRRGHTMAPEAQRPSQWPCLTQLPREIRSQLIVSKAL